MNVLSNIAILCNTLVVSTLQGTIGVDLLHYDIFCNKYCTASSVYVCLRNSNGLECCAEIL